MRRTLEDRLQRRIEKLTIIRAVRMVAVIALTFDWLGALAERYLKPRGL